VESAEKYTEIQPYEGYVEAAAPATEKLKPNTPFKKRGQHIEIMQIGLYLCQIFTSEK
jgi:hypothetical protein